MEIVLHLLSWSCLLAGGFFCVVGGIGLLRLPDFYSRTHAAGLTDTLGAGLILIGLTLQSLEYHWLVVVKLLLILVFLFFTSPTASHALVRAAFTRGLEPELHGQEFDEKLLEGELKTVADPAERKMGGERKWSWKGRKPLP